MEESDVKISLGRLSIRRSSDTQMENSSNLNREYQFPLMSAVEILRDTVRILRYNFAGFMAIAALLIVLYLLFNYQIFVDPDIDVGLVFSILFANAIIVCNVAVVISVLEDACGPQALLRSSVLIRGQTQVGLHMYLGSTMGMAFVQGLFEHRVKTLSYGDGQMVLL